MSFLIPFTLLTSRNVWVFVSWRPSSALLDKQEKAVNSTRGSSESQKATLPVRLSRDFRLSVPSNTSSVRREDFSLHAGSFAAGFTILFPFYLIKSRGGEDAVAYTGETAFEPSGGDELE
jgi:hypothetical protein